MKDAGTEGLASSPEQTEGGRTTMVGRFGARSKARTGEAVKAAVDTRALHFFDPETGLGIYDGTKGERMKLQRLTLLGLLLAVLLLVGAGAEVTTTTRGGTTAGDHGGERLRLHLGDRRVDRSRAGVVPGRHRRVHLEEPGRDA